MQSTEDKTRFYFGIPDINTWYSMIAECNTLFGKNWRGKKNVRKQFSTLYNRAPVVWFDVPDKNFATFVTLKYNITLLDPKSTHYGE